MKTPEEKLREMNARADQLERMAAAMRYAAEFRHDRRTYRRYVYAGPALILATFLGIALILLLAGTARAHTTYKGHQCYYFAISTPSGPQHYREFWTAGYGSGPHFHDYKTQWFDDTCSNGCGDWELIHRHYGRAVPGHPV